MLDEPRVLPRRVNQCRCHLLPENNEVIREPETRLARMLIRFVSASLSTTKNGLRTAELSYGAVLPEYSGNAGHGHGRRPPVGVRRR